MKIKTGLYKVEFEGYVIVKAEDGVDALDVFNSSIGDICEDEVDNINSYASEINSPLELDKDWLKAYPYDTDSSNKTCEEIFKDLGLDLESIEKERIRQEYDEKYQLKLPL